MSVGQETPPYVCRCLPPKKIRFSLELSFAKMILITAICSSEFQDFLFLEISPVFVSCENERHDCSSLLQK